MKLFNNIFSVIKDFVYRFNKDNVSVFAASASFFIIISSIPFLMLLLGLAKYIIPFSKHEILAAVSRFMPHDVYYFISDIINELFSRTPGPLISITAIAMLWSASRGVLAIIQGLNEVFKISKYGFFKEQIFSFFYTFFFILALILTLIVLLISKILARYFSALVFIPIFFVLLTLLLAGFYTYLPGRRVKLKTQIPGALFTGLLWVGFTYAYSVYIDKFSDFSYIYGSLAAIVLLMLWLFICMNIFLCGAEINQMLKEKNFNLK